MKLTTTKRLERLTERYMNGGMDRRTFLGVVAAAAGRASLEVLNADGQVVSLLSLAA